MLLFAITKHCCRSGKISLVEEQQQQDVATGVSCPTAFPAEGSKKCTQLFKECYSKRCPENQTP